MHNAGGVLILVLFAALVALPVANYFMGTLPPVRPFSLALPAFTLLNLNIFGKMGFGALGGFEYTAIVAGECRDPARTIGRSVVIAAPIIAAMFILGTGAVLCFVRPEQVDLIGPVAQVLEAGSQPLGLVSGIAPIVIMAITIVRVAQASVNFTGSTRLPMVAGWDNLLPQWFVRLHPALPHAGELDSVRRRRHAGFRDCRGDRRRGAGSLSAAQQRVRNLLRADVPGHVRAAYRRVSRRTVASTALVEGCGHVRLSHDGVVSGAFDLSDRSGGQCRAVHFEDHPAGAWNERRGRCALPGIPATAASHPRGPFDC